MPPAATFKTAQDDLPSIGGAAAGSGALPSLGGLPALGGGRKPFAMGGVHGRAGGFDVDLNMKR